MNKERILTAKDKASEILNLIDLALEEDVETADERFELEHIYVLASEIFEKLTFCSELK